VNVFTGLVQAVGQVYSEGGDVLKITWVAQQSGLIHTELEVGDSVAVDGVCLTVDEFVWQGFVAIASPETRDRSTLGRQQGAWVNLEASLRVGSKLGGHFVTGHVDGIGTVRSIQPTDTAWEIAFTAPESVARYVLTKGSIAVNGISLTVADCDPDGTWFTVAVIPHTYHATNLQYLRPGSLVNLEGDILGKYVEKFLRSPQPMATRAAESLSPGFLMEHGYL
jgi:riboflavin synthase